MKELSENEVSGVSGGADGEYLYYAVTWGDTLPWIARRFFTTVETLIKLNNIKDPEKLQLGQILIIPRY